MPCNTCGTVFSTGHLCNTCNNFHLCTNCYVRDGHIHQMQLVNPLPLPSPPTNVASSSSGAQPQACALEQRDPPVLRFIRALAAAYNKQGSGNRVSQLLFCHLAQTQLVCNCTSCKQMVLLYRYHNKKCRMAWCLLEECPIIKQKLVKKRLSTTDAEDIEQKLLRLRLAVKNIQAAAILKEAQVPPRNGPLSRKFTIQRCIRTLVHASRCNETTCMPSSCHKMKRILTHIKICKFRSIGGCIICRQLCTLCCYHARNCQENKCPVPLCSFVKGKLQNKAIAAKFDL